MAKRTATARKPKPKKAPAKKAAPRKPAPRKAEKKEPVEPKNDTEPTEGPVATLEETERWKLRALRAEWDASGKEIQKLEAEVQALQKDLQLQIHARQKAANSLQAKKLEKESQYNAATKEIGEKYEFEPADVGIDLETGVVTPLEKKSDPDPEEDDREGSET